MAQFRKLFDNAYKAGSFRRTHVPQSLSAGLLTDAYLLLWMNAVADEGFSHEC